MKRVTKDKKNQVDIEPNYCISGIVAFLNQFNPTSKNIYMGLLAQNIKSQFNLLQVQQSSKQADTLAELLTSISFFDEIVKVSGESGNVILINIFVR